MNEHESSERMEDQRILRVTSPITGYVYELFFYAIPQPDAPMLESLFWRRDETSGG